MEDPKKRGNSVRKEGCCQSGHFSSWGVANVTTVTFNYILVIVFLFSLNVGVSPCFHCTVLFPVYKVYTSCLHNTVVSSCYRWHTSCLHHAGVTSCFRLQIVSTNSKFPSVLRNISSAEVIFSCKTQICFFMMGLGANFTMREVESSANSCANCHYDT